MARNKGRPEDIYRSIKERLIDRVPDCKEANCWFSLNPQVVAPHPGSLGFAVSPASGSFREGYFDGGGLEQLTADGGLIVAIHSTLQLDQVQQDAKLLEDASIGLWPQAGKVLAALADPSWSPMKGSDEITRDPLIPAGYRIVKNDRRLGSIELEFKCNFDWDVS